MKFPIVVVFLLIVFTSDAQSLQETKGPMVAAHRCGFYPLYPENSIEMVEHVISNTFGVPVMFEFDVRKSKDGNLYVLHDEKVDRTTNGSGLLKELPDTLLNGMRLKTLDGRLSSGSLFTLSEWLDSIALKNCLFMFDVKDGGLREVVEMVRAKNLENRSILLLFTEERFSERESIRSEIAFSYLVENETSWKRLRDSSTSSRSKFAYITEKTPDNLITEIKESGIRILGDVSEMHRNAGNVYPPNFYQKFVKQKGLDILITDFPVEVFHFLNSEK